MEEWYNNEVNRGAEGRINNIKGVLPEVIIRIEFDHFYWWTDFEVISESEIHNQTKKNWHAL
jgi:hypothetical protein